MRPSFERAFKIYVFAFAFFFASRPLSDPDFWFHLKTGEFILHTGSIPRTDIFSFTNYGKAWVAHEWLAEAIFYAIYSRLGFNSLIFIFAILTTLAFWIVFKRCQAHSFIGGFAMLLGVWTVLPTVGVRPRAFTLLLASIFLAILARYARQPVSEPGATATGPSRAGWWLVPLMVLWVNLHGGFLIGLVLIALTIVGIPLDAWAAGEQIKAEWPRVRMLLFVFVGCLIAGMLNPHGPSIYTFPFEIFFSPVQQQVIVDWLSPDFHDGDTLPLALLILLTIGALALSPKRVRPSELLIFLATLYATLKSQRHMAMMALVAVPLLAKYLQDWLDTTSFRRFFQHVQSPPLRWSNLVVMGLLLVPLLPFAAKLRSKVYESRQQEVMSIPLWAVEYLKQNRITGNTFTDPNIWGGYVIWELPSNPVYIDGRIDMYGDEFVREFLGIIRGRRDWRAPFDRYKVSVVIIRPKSVLGRELRNSPDWMRVFQDDMAVAFKRVTRPQ